jgi:hypothetical protein
MKLEVRDPTFLALLGWLDAPERVSAGMAWHFVVEPPVPWDPNADVMQANPFRQQTVGLPIVTIATRRSPAAPPYTWLIYSSARVPLDTLRRIAAFTEAV